MATRSKMDAALKAVKGSMLNKPSERDNNATIKRKPSSYIPIPRFKLSNVRSYQQQYGDMYFLRLSRIKPAVEKIGAEAWRDTVIGGEPAKKVDRVLDVKQGELCWVIGTCYMDMPLKPNILDDVSKDRWTFNPVSTQKYTSDVPGVDQVMLEDESGRIHLVGSELEHVNLVTGAIIAVLGTENVNGELEVLDIKFPDVPEQPPRWILTKPPMSEEKDDDVGVDVDMAEGEPDSDSDVPNNHNHIAIVSGLNFSSTDTSYSLECNLLLDFLLGESLDPGTQRQRMANISRLVIAGNSISMVGVVDKVVEKDTKERRKKYGYDASAYNPMPPKLFDEFLTELLPSMPITLMPGATDPANASFPQQPIHIAMLPTARRWANSPAEDATAAAVRKSKKDAAGVAWLDLSTNPLEAEIEGWRMLGTSGQNVDDLSKYTSHTDRVGMLEAMCRWRCCAPTAPDTLWTYPFADDDPFVLRECPHVFFAGNQPRFATRMVDGPRGEKVRLMCIPAFSETRELVLLDTVTLEVRIVRFAVG